MLGVAGDLRAVALDGVLGHGVGDHGAGLRVLGQAVEGALPVVGLGEVDLLAGVLSVGEQAHGGLGGRRADPLLLDGHRDGAVVVGELKRVVGGNLSVRERHNRARDGVAGPWLLLAAGFAAHESKASRKHRLFGGTGHGVDDTRQHVAVGRLALGGELAHAILVALLKVVYANGLASLDGMGAAVLERKGVTHGLAIRIEYACLIALLGIRQGELKRKRQIVAFRILGGRGKATVRRHGLSHLQACHATIGILHGRCRGKEMVELERDQVSTIGGPTVLIEGHAVDTRIGIDSRQLAVAIATVLDIAQDGLGALRRLVIAHVHQVVRQRGRYALGGALLAPRQASAGVNGRTLQLALDVRKRVVNRIGRAKLRQGGNQRTWATHAEHAVAYHAGIHIHTRIVHNHLGDGVVNLIAIRAYRLTQVVHTLDKGFGVFRIEWEARRALNLIRIGRVVRPHGVIWLGTRFNGIRAGTIAGNILGLV